MKILAILSLFFYSCISYGVISCSLEQNDNGRCVLILGDCHQEELDDINEGHIKSIKKIIDRLGVKESAVWYYELSSSQIPSKFGKNTAKSIEVLRSLASKFKDIEFKAYDPRTAESDIANGYFTDLQSVILDENPIWDYDTFESQIKQLPVNRSRQKCELLEGYIQSLEDACTQIKKWRDKYSSASKEYELFDEKLTLFTSSKEEIIEKFGNDKSKLFASALLEVFEKESTSGKPFEELDKLHNLLFNNCDYIYADAGFLRKCLKEPKNCIFLVGRIHQEALSHDLQALDYKNKIYGKSWEELDKNLYKYHFDKKFNESIANGLSYLLCPSERMRIINALQDAKQTEEKKEELIQVKKCFHCGISEDKLEKNLLRCTACKSALYCKIACQRADWPSHKQVCHK